jgi:7-keto-8-aminopelargonate synthetase-like enzyme
MSSKFSTDHIDISALMGGSFLFRTPKGKTLAERHTPFNQYVDLLKVNGVYPFGRIATSPLGGEMYVSNTWADEDKACINFGSQDYLGLSNHPEVIKAAKESIDKYGINAGGSPVLGGQNVLTSRLGKKIAEALRVEQAHIFPNGWSACFGAIAGLVTARDCVVMDMLMHNSSYMAAKYATEHVYKFKHNDLEDLERKLKFWRDRNTDSGLFVVIETLYSMNSDGPDMTGIYDLCQRYEAILIVDVAHEFGCMGEDGLGLMSDILKNRNKDNLVITGSLSKVMASIGGFVAGPRSIRQQIEIFSPSFTFATGISPIACCTALKALEIIQSEEGAALRRHLMKLVHFTIDELNKRGFITNGYPSPIIPVLIGDAQLARLLSREVLTMGLIANLIEFPAVPRNKSIIRIQMMANMKEEHILRACTILHEAIIKVQGTLLNAKIDAIEILPEEGGD